MKEQLPLKRIFIGFAASIVTAAAVTAAGSVNETVHGDSKGRSFVSANTASDYYLSVQAPVIALNHEENIETIQKLDLLQDQNLLPKSVALPEALDISEIKAEKKEKEEYIVEEWWKAKVSDYSEDLEQQGYVTIETQTPQAPADVQPNANGGAASASGEPIVMTPGPVGDHSFGAGQSPNMPDQLQPNTFYFTSYGYGHGVGMSQNGANYYATYAGYDYLQIIQHYYPGTTVMYVPGSESETVSVKNYSGNVVDIVSMVCNAEIGSSFNVEAIKAQAVAAYSYIKYSGGSTNGMAIKPNPDQKIIDAVKSVVGQAVYYDGRFALTQFCASSGGTTASCKDVFYDDIPYLRSVGCDVDAAYDPNYGLVTAISVDTLRTRIQNKYSITLSSDYSNWIQLVEGDGGYIADVVIDGQKTVDGYAFARAIGLKSGKFTILYT